MKKILPKKLSEEINKETDLIKLLKSKSNIKDGIECIIENIYMKSQAEIIDTFYKIYGKKLSQGTVSKNLKALKAKKLDSGYYGLEYSLNNDKEELKTYIQKCVLEYKLRMARVMAIKVAIGCEILGCKIISDIYEDIIAIPAYGAIVLVYTPITIKSKNHDGDKTTKKLPQSLQDIKKILKEIEKQKSKK